MSILCEWFCSFSRLICSDTLSFTQTPILVIVSLTLAQSYSASLRFARIRSFPFRYTQSHSDPHNVTQIRSVSLRWLRSHTDLLSLMQFTSASLRFTNAHSVSIRFTQSRSNWFDPLSRARIHSSPLSVTQFHSRFFLPPSDPSRFTKISSDLLRLGQTD